MVDDWEPTGLLGLGTQDKKVDITGKFGNGFD
jgi:hypothetical protein